MSGSGSALPLIRILAAAQPDKRVEFVFLPGLHTAGGIKGVQQGGLDVGGISRSLDGPEKSPDLRTVWLSKDGLLIAAHPSVGKLGVRGLTSAQVRKIYEGKITDWRQVGATAKMRIVVLDRHEDESSKIALRQFLLGSHAKVTSDALRLYYETDMVEALQSTPGAIGYFSLGYATSEQVDVQRLRIDGVEPSIASIENGDYRLVRPIGFVMRSHSPTAVAEFATWATSDAARDVMTYKGYAPYYH